MPSVGRLRGCVVKEAGVERVAGADADIPKPAEIASTKAVKVRKKRATLLWSLTCCVQLVSLSVDGYVGNVAF